MKSLRLIGVLLVIAACVALAGAALAGKASKPVRHTHVTKVHRTTPGSRATRHVSSGPAEQSDPDNVQSGDQTTPDQPGEQSSESESESADTEAGQQGEPAQGQGHEDPAGADVNHECTGNCQE